MRPRLKYTLVLCLLLAAAFAGWSWLRPYAWQPDPAARCQVVETLVTRDQSFYWVNVHLKVNPGMAHDLQKPVYLTTAAGVKHEPADTAFAGAEGQSPTDIWFKFWLEPSDLTGALILHLNDGTLSIKSTQGIPTLEPAASKNFTTHQW
jgi:hypothetical protein